MVSDAIREGSVEGVGVGGNGGMMADEPITWTQRVDNLRKSLGREPNLYELVELSRLHELTPEEVQAQRDSFGRHNVSTGDPRLD